VQRPGGGGGGNCRRRPLWGLRCSLDVSIVKFPSNGFVMKPIPILSFEKLDERRRKNRLIQKSIL